MSYPERTAFIVSNPRFIAEILNQKPAVFHIFLVGPQQIQNVNVTPCPDMSFHDTAVQICREMLDRRLIHIVSDDSNRLLEQKVSELVRDSFRFAMSGAIQNALANLWRNLPFIPGSLSVDSAGHLLKNVPAIIVASGPSLQKNIHLLNALKNRAILISCSSALGPLLRREIMPHFEVVVDPNPAMYEALKPCLDSPTCFVLSLFSHHRISRECAGRRMYFPVNFDRKALEDLKRFTQIQTVLPAMASVATTALFFALHLGCDPIIFVGLDLCYADDRTHIDRTDAPADTCIFETPDGRRVRSSPAMKEAFDFYRDFIPTIKDRKIVNATEGGAGIHGTEPITLAEAAARYLTHTIILPDLAALQMKDIPWKSRLNELRNGFQSMHVRTAGISRKIRTQMEKGRDGAIISAKIIDWFESLRTMAGYEYLASCLDWVCYKAVISDGLEPKLELLAATEQILQQQVRVVEESIKKGCVPVSAEGGV